MKRSIIYVLVLALFLMGLVAYEGQYSQDATAASDNVTYRFPYFHTAGANVIYCVASNYTGTSAGVTLTPRSSGGSYSASSFSLVSLGNLPGNTTDMFTFNGSSATSLVGGANATISGPDTSAKGAFYSADLSFGNTTAAAGTLDCSNILLACFQGTSTPKRNLVGYFCMMNTTATFGTGVRTAGANSSAPLAETSGIGGTANGMITY